LPYDAYAHAAYDYRLFDGAPVALAILYAACNYEAIVEAFLGQFGESRHEIFQPLVRGDIPEEQQSLLIFINSKLLFRVRGGKVGIRNCVINSKWNNAHLLFRHTEFGDELGFHLFSMNKNVVA